MDYTDILFLVSPQKHTLWVFISTLLVSIQTYLFVEKKKNISRCWLKNGLSKTMIRSIHFTKEC